MEIHGHKLHMYPPIKVGDVDHRAGRVLLRDTKNRSDHKLLLSRPALEIAKRNCAGRKADEPLFPIVDARKTLSWINEEAGTKVQGHGLRSTFASIAEELVSSALLKADDESRDCWGRDARALRGQERGAASGRMAGGGGLRGRSGSGGMMQYPRSLTAGPPAPDRLVWNRVALDRRVAEVRVGQSPAMRTLTSVRCRVCRPNGLLTHLPPPPSRWGSGSEPCTFDPGLDYPARNPR